MKFDVSQIGSFAIAVLVVFMIYRRFRRSFGQQLLSPVRMQIRIGLLILVGGLLLPAALRSVAFLLAMLGGLTAGVLLAAWGGARTRFIKSSNQLYYVPHTYTGIAVSFLFLGRLVYRLAQAYSKAPAAHTAGAAPASQIFLPTSMLTTNMLQSPLTFALFFVLMGYYVCYYCFVLWKSKRTVPEEVGLIAPLPTAHP